MIYGDTSSVLATKDRQKAAKATVIGVRPSPLRLAVRALPEPRSDSGPTPPSLSHAFSTALHLPIPRKHSNCFMIVLGLVLSVGIFCCYFISNTEKNSPGLCGAPHSLPFSTRQTYFKDSIFFFIKGTIHTESSTCSAEPEPLLAVKSTMPFLRP